MPFVLLAFVLLSCPRVCVCVCVFVCVCVCVCICLFQLTAVVAAGNRSSRPFNRSFRLFNRSSCLFNRSRLNETLLNWCGVVWVWYVWYI